ncbi:MAG: UDP-glucose--hexose-1-phosphate uridylyltransferase [Gemmatimonadota bacterium]
MSDRARERPHRRLNLLTGEWVLVSPHRMERPWQGQVERAVSAQRPPYDGDCYLCPGNARAQGERNPDYDATHVFTNDFPALLPHLDGATGRRYGTAPRDYASDAAHAQPLLRSEPVAGTCRVVCFSPRHDLTLAEMALAGIRTVIDTWADQSAELGRTYRWVQVFENKGEVMGCSNPHPHGQIWALDVLPSEPHKEDRQQRAHFAEHGRALLLDYAQAEAQSGERVVVANDDWLAVVPHWAIWPFELLLLPRRPVARLPELRAAERDNLARVLKQILVRYDNLFGVSFPYSMGWHGAPFDAGAANHWQLHAHFYPPLLRSATVKKFMVGFELLAEAQRDLTAEQAAERLRALSDVHASALQYA